MHAGLPPSPPSTQSTVSSIDDGPKPGHDNNGIIMKPLGVDVTKKLKERSNGRMIFIIVLSLITVFVLFIGLTWLCLLKYSFRVHEDGKVSNGLMSPSSKQPSVAKERHGNERC